MPAEPPTDPPLGRAGLATWRAITDVGYVLRPDEVVVLTQACRLLDQAEALQAAIDHDGVTVTGSRGQIRPHPALAELRGTRAEVARLLGRLKLPDPQPAAAGSSLTSERARKAARARWSKSRTTPPTRGARRGDAAP